MVGGVGPPGVGERCWTRVKSLKRSYAFNSPRHVESLTDPKHLNNATFSFDPTLAEHPGTRMFSVAIFAQCEKHDYR